MYKVTLLLGDGVGPEIAQATKKCIDATGVNIDWDVQDCGIEVIEATGGVPDSVMEAIKKNDVTIKAPITTPIGKGFRSINVHLRQELGLYACVRPCKQYKGVRTFFEHVPVDLVLIRENTEDLYAGVEFKAGEEKITIFPDNPSTDHVRSPGRQFTSLFARARRSCQSELSKWPRSILDAFFNRRLSASNSTRRTYKLRP
jgi:isocitrate dehydrogenase